MVLKDAVSTLSPHPDYFASLLAPASPAPAPASVPAPAPAPAPPAYAHAAAFALDSVLSQVTLV